MSTLLIWLSGHRGIIIALIGLSLWGTAYYWYFGTRLLIPYIKRGQPHNWNVNMVTKRATSRGKEEIR